jgi:hypothetical protein
VKPLRCRGVAAYRSIGGTVGGCGQILAPELTPAAAADVQRAFAQCVWRPGTGGATTGTVTFTRR